MLRERVLAANKQKEVHLCDDCDYCCRSVKGSEYAMCSLTQVHKPDYVTGGEYLHWESCRDTNIGGQCQNFEPSADCLSRRDLDEMRTVPI
jgi:hypothetical protein